MKDIRFFSNNTYLFLPTASNPKVALAIDNENMVNNAFKLYKPYSKIAKLIKLFFFKTSKSLIYVLICKKYKKSDFIRYLENKLEKNVVSSVYYATDRDKVILQICAQENFTIIGYIKIALNSKGNVKIENEIKAIHELENINFVDKNYIIFDGYFENNKYVFVKELPGTIIDIEHLNVDSILLKLKRCNKYYLNEHPRILELKNDLLILQKFDLLFILDKAVKKCNTTFYLVYEHGDFAPWNIILNKSGGYELFDFEYFVKDGLEYLDKIKYYFQIADLLEGMGNDDLIYYIENKIINKDFYIIFTIFLIKEIIHEIQSGNSIDKLNDILEKITEKF